MDLRLSHARVRLPRADDAPAIARHLDDRAIVRNLLEPIPLPYGVDDARALLATQLHREPVRLVAIEVEGECAGLAELRTPPPPRAHGLELALWIGRRHHGKGIASELLPLLVNHAFARDAALMRVEAQVLGWNDAAIRLLTRCGFSAEARLRDAVSRDGEVCDLLVFGMLRAEAAARCATFRC